MAIYNKNTVSDINRLPKRCFVRFHLFYLIFYDTFNGSFYAIPVSSFYGNLYLLRVSILSIYIDVTGSLTLSCDGAILADSCYAAL